MNTHGNMINMKMAWMNKWEEKIRDMYNIQRITSLLVTLLIYTYNFIIFIENTIVKTMNGNEKRARVVECSYTHRN